VTSLSRFDPLAEDYESWFATPLGAFVAQRERELILHLLEANSGKTIVEVGSGTGYFLREVAFFGARCVGVEPSAEMLAVSMSRSGRAIDYVRGCGEALPIKDATVDAVLFMTTLEFVQDVDATIREAARVVRPDGKLVIGVLNAEGPWAQARRREGGLWRDARFFSGAELKAELSHLGAIRVEYCVHVPPNASSWPRPLMRLADWLLRRLLPAKGALIGIQVRLGRPR